MLEMLFMIIVAFLIVTMVCGVLMLWKIPVPRQTKEELFENPSITVIIPARNEEGRLQPLLESLQKQSLKPKEIIVVDDESTDRTVQIAKEFGGRVIQTHEGDLSWKGKSAACWIGSKAATGDWLLFLDADTRMENENSLKTLALNYQSQKERGILSVQPYHKVNKLYENFSAIFNIIVITGMNVFTVWSTRLESAGAFGPCILTARKDYMDAGGHFVVGEAIMDDFELAKAFKKIGIPVRCISGRGVLNFQMYPEGMNSLIEGWTKNFGTASRSTHPLVMSLISTWISGSFLPIALLILGFYIGFVSWIAIACICYVGFMIQVYLMARRTGNFRFYVFIIYPILFFFFIGIFSWSLVRTKVFRTVTWKGRKINV
ncbi:glycosyltransferase [Psychrobacillus sp. MER TA 171]|uniref:glycosyltransferase n=1 Tax=Psychrobacillus sp. MER TA 171 TaxID=2939577 RepID=UPI00203F1B61|nr:glycosyltransferase [Psychrobacillus sp. MER TA 171]MCM3357756.1 glycosyltransferase [Psychrobacillus sp. MER TA 171]